MKSLPRFALLLVMSSSGLLACGGEDTGVEEPPTIEETTFAASLNIDLEQMTRTGTGLYYRDLVTTQGAAATVGTTVAVRYTGWLSNGTQFDSNVNGALLSFQVGNNQVVPGFDEGVRGMRVGGRRQLIIPPALAYGSAGSGAVPGNAIIVFAVELITVQ